MYSISSRFVPWDIAERVSSFINASKPDDDGVEIIACLWSELHFTIMDNVMPKAQNSESFLLTENDELYLAFGRLLVEMARYCPVPEGVLFNV